MANNTKRTWPDAKSKTRTRTCNLDLDLDLVLGRLANATRRVGVDVARTTQCLMPSETFVLLLSATVVVAAVVASVVGVVTSVAFYAYFSAAYLHR